MTEADKVINIQDFGSNPADIWIQILFTDQWSWCIMQTRNLFDLSEITLFSLVNNFTL